LWAPFLAPNFGPLRPRPSRPPGATGDPWRSLSPPPRAGPGPPRPRGLPVSVSPSMLGASRDRKLRKLSTKCSLPDWTRPPLRLELGAYSGEKKIRPIRCDLIFCERLWIVALFPEVPNPRELCSNTLRWRSKMQRVGIFKKDKNILRPSQILKGSLRKVQTFASLTNEIFCNNSTSPVRVRSI